jgi:uncharacterized membrane protein HdeD (DUF308 family)
MSHVGFLCTKTLWNTPAMTTADVPKLLPHIWKSTLICGLVAAVVGAVILAQPSISIVGAVTFFGVYFLVVGAAQILPLSLHVSAPARMLLLVSAGASIVVGVMSVLRLYDAGLLLALGVGVALTFRGVGTAMSAVADTSLPARGWSFLVGAISLIAGVVLLAWPFDSSATLVMRVDGIVLTVVGIAETVSAFRIRKSTRTDLSRREQSDDDSTVNTPVSAEDDVAEANTSAAPADEATATEARDEDENVEQ